MNSPAIFLSIRKSSGDKEIFWHKTETSEKTTETLYFRDTAQTWDDIWEPTLDDS